MVISNHYDWSNGAEIKSHSRVKLDILGEYLREYVNVRCGLPQQERFRLSVVDGFSGGGMYACGTLGSPLVIIQSLSEISKEINIRRQTEGFKSISFQFYLYFNDLSHGAIDALKTAVKGKLQEIADDGGDAQFLIQFSVGDFGENLPNLEQQIKISKVKNSIFNLDQYGYSDVSEDTLRRVLTLTRSSEVFLTFSIQSFLTFVNPAKLQKSRIFEGQISEISLNKTKKEWLADVERLVFEEFHTVAPFVSPFSINNADGWEYWLVHFAQAYRARQVYNDILHRKKNSQAHVGRSGLQMLKYSSIEETSLYLFDRESREIARGELLGDVPKFLTDGVKDQTLSVEDFYGRTYNQTPAHSDDVNNALIHSNEIEVVTAHGGKRRKAQMIRKTDFIRLAPQRTFHFAR